MSWDDYYRNTEAGPPSRLLLEALERIALTGPSEGKLAIDLGCGAGRDSLELLRRGWRVIAYDRNQMALDFLKEKARAYSTQLTCYKNEFEAIHMLPKASLVYAGHSLPFCGRTAFDPLWSNVLQAVETDGWLAVDFFGPEDDWVKSGHVLGYSEAQVRQLLGDLQLERIHTRNEHGKTATGPDKHWHVMSVIASRR